MCSTIVSSASLSSWIVRESVEAESLRKKSSVMPLP